MKFFIKDIFSKCDQIHRKLDLVAFAEEILNENLHFLYSVTNIIQMNILSPNRCDQTLAKFKNCFDVEIERIRVFCVLIKRAPTC